MRVIWDRQAGCANEGTAGGTRGVGGRTGRLSEEGHFNEAVSTEGEK